MDFIYYILKNKKFSNYFKFFILKKIRKLYIFFKRYPIEEILIFIRNFYLKFKFDKIIKILKIKYSIFYNNSIIITYMFKIFIKFH